MSLDEIRKKIDALDARLVELLNDRTKLALEIGHLKKKTGHEIYVPAREKDVLNRVAKLNKGPLTTEAVQSVYREVMSAALALECNVKVAYLGPPATFTHQASRLKFGGSIDYVPCETIRDVFSAVQKQTADYGVVPIENSTEGAVTHTLDEFVTSPLKICAEIYLPISQHLMSSVSRKKIKRIYSIPQALGQCRHWLNDNMPGVELISVSSTARGAEMAQKDKHGGAVASQLAADIYKLNIVGRDIQDLNGNMTRFLVIAKSYGRPTGSDKTSLFFSVKHKVGALYDALGAFKKNKINMTKIESRPNRTKAWEYYFFVDVDGHAEDKALKRALQTVGKQCAVMTVLGSYPKSIGSDS